MYSKSFSSISKLIALILIFTCSVLFTEVASSQIKDESSNPTSEQSDNSGESKTFLYIGVAAVIVAIAVYLLVKKPDDKKTESDKNVNVKDSTIINKTDTTKIKK